MFYIYHSNTTTFLLLEIKCAISALLKSSQNAPMLP